MHAQWHCLHQNILYRWGNAQLTCMTLFNSIAMLRNSLCYPWLYFGEWFSYMCMCRYNYCTFFEVWTPMSCMFTCTELSLLNQCYVAWLCWPCLRLILFLGIHCLLNFGMQDIQLWTSYNYWIIMVPIVSCRLHTVVLLDFNFVDTDCIVHACSMVFWCSHSSLSHTDILDYIPIIIIVQVYACSCWS